jgi:hypothetical protein
MHKIKFTYSKTDAGRKHYLIDDDVQVLPEELWEKLQAVHFNDRAWGRRCLGYVTRGHREITICALPSRVSLTTYLAFRDPTAHRRHRSPREFGAVRGRQWTEIAVRRFMLYDVFLHELGHLQIIEPTARTLRRQFARETKAQEFADYWREALWSRQFDHADSVHNRPACEELERLTQDSTSCVVT